jgi:hypothetical protein
VIKPGWQIGTALGTTLVKDSSTSDVGSWWLLFELDVQYGVRRQDGSGWAIQLKVPDSIAVSALDFYFETPDAGHLSFGAGFELSMVPGLYGVMTYQANQVFFTVTLRASYDQLVSVASDQSPFVINPQISIGVGGASVFVGYRWYAAGIADLGKELNIPRNDTYGDHMLVAGIGARW